MSPDWCEIMWSHEVPLPGWVSFESRIVPAVACVWRQRRLCIFAKIQAAQGGHSLDFGVMFGDDFLFC